MQKYEGELNSDGGKKREINTDLILTLGLGQFYIGYVHPSHFFSVIRALQSPLR